MPFSFLKNFRVYVLALAWFALIALVPVNDHQAEARSNTASSSSVVLEDTPELPAADGSSDTPEIMVDMVDKSKVKLSSLRGKVVILDFFWSQCSHCRDHAPHVVELYNKYKGQLSVLGLATDGPEKVGDVKAFMRDLKITYPVGYISTELIAYYTDAHNHGVPQVVIFGTNGKMVKRLIGWSDENSRELVEAIKSQLGDAPASAAPVKPNASKASGKSSRTTARRTARG